MNINMANKDNFITFENYRNTIDALYSLKRGGSISQMYNFFKRVGRGSKEPEKSNNLPKEETLKDILGPDDPTALKTDPESVNYNKVIRVHNSKKNYNNTPLKKINIPNNATRKKE